MVAGVVGAMALDISPTMFLVRMQDSTELYYLWLGLIKAPVFAFLIACIGCLEGLQVSGNAQSVGERTTSSVVQTISLVIVLDDSFSMQAGGKDSSRNRAVAAIRSELRASRYDPVRLVLAGETLNLSETLGSGNVGQYTAVASVLLTFSFVMLICINLLERWSQRHEG